MSESRRLLGFAFANADFLVEIDAEGTILYLTGAVARFTSTPDLVGTPLRDLFEQQDGARFAAQIQLLPACSRVTMRLKTQERGEAHIALFRLPDNDNRISCAISQPEVRAVAPAETVDRKTGLPMRDSFIVNAIAKATDSDALTLVDLPELPKVCAEWPAEKSDALLAAIGQSITNSGAKTAGRLSPTTFAALADATTGAKSQIPPMRAALTKHGLPAADIHEYHLAMRSPQLRPEQRLLALRHVIDYYAGGKRQFRVANDVVEAFEGMMDEAQLRIRQLIESVAAGEFALAYQAVVELATADTSYFEALARFDTGQTGAAVGFMESLGITNTFDFVVALKVIAALETDKSHGAQVAFNVSGNTIQSAAGFGMLVSFLMRHRKLLPRLMIEINESGQITDTTAAARAIEALRTMGARVGLDEVRANSQTLNHLEVFTLDFIKFDGSVVNSMGSTAQTDKQIGTILKLCRELGVVSIATGLDTAKNVERARSAGFKLGQGDALGVPGIIPAGSGMKRDTVRRKGVMETWQ